MIGISHEGGTAATNRALAAASAARRPDGADHRRAPDRPAASCAEIVVETVEMDQSWCHTVGYLSPIVAAAAVGGAALRPDARPRTTSATLLAAGAARRGRRRGDRRPSSPTPDDLLVDRLRRGPAGRPRARAEGRGGVLAAVGDARPRDVPPRPPAGDRTRRPRLVLILTDRRRARGSRSSGRARRSRRPRSLGVRAAAIVARDVDAALPDELTPAGRLIVDEAPALPAPVAALLGTATPLQLLTERIARARGTNPDPIRRDDPLYRDGRGRR